MAFTDSEPAGATLILQGIWIHDPADPEGTARGYPYGGPTGQVQRDRAAEESLFAGRTFPVVDVGPYRREVAQVVAHVPFDQDWSARIAELRALPESDRAWQYRDGRGRAMLGTISGTMERDEQWGSTVSFAVSRVDGVA